MFPQGTPKFVRPRVIRQHIGIHATTLWKWSKEGHIECLIGKGGHRFYNIHSVAEYFGLQTAGAKQGKRYIYARVSSHKQRADLERQIAFLQKAYPEHEVVSDVASGINFKRRGLQQVLDECYKGMVEEIVVAHRDRLCRFAFDLMQSIFRNTGVKLVVHHRHEQTEEDELAQDLLSIVNVFVAKNNGRRAAFYRKERKANEETKEETTGSGGRADAGDRKSRGKGVKRSRTTPVHPDPEDSIVSH